MSPMRRSLTGVVTLLFTAVFVLPSASQTTVSAGGACWPSGKTTISEGKRYTCIKVGSKRVWDRGVAVPTVGPKTTARLTSPTLETSGGQPMNFVDLTTNRAVQAWLPNFGPGTKVYHLYAERGSTLNLSWNITNTTSGQVWPNKRVGLIVNSNLGGAQSTTFRYTDTSGVRTVKENIDGRGQSVIFKTADSSGNVSFSLTNTNSIAQAEPKPVAQNVLQPAQNIQLFSYISLTGYSSTLNETRDILIVHFTKPDSKLLWADDFSGSSGQDPNADNWNVITGDGCPLLCGWGNDEREFYLDTANRTDGNGNMVISTKRLTQATAQSCYPFSCQWSSGKFTSQGKVEVQYGLVEARIKVAGGPGTWPAFWMLGKNIDEVGWPFSGEIDIMEIAGNDPTKVVGTAHSINSVGDHIWNGGFMYTNENVSDQFHTFSVLWQPNRIDWFIDGQNYYTLSKTDLGSSPWVFNQPFYIILNTAMGGGFGGDIAPYLTSATTTIDWVRVYQHGAIGCVKTSSTTNGSC